METHPLARAEYMRLFGTLTGRRHIADSVFNDLVCRYMRVADDALRKNGGAPKAVMVNIPYGDVWYIPGEDSYLSCLIKDAGGWIIGAGKGSGSSVITMEDAYRYSQDADVWLNPGYCRTREQLSAVHQLFPMFGPIAENRPIYNNTLKITPEGGNDFYESGVVRPDLILEDLISIFSSQSEPEKLNYFIPL